MNFGLNNIVKSSDNLHQIKKADLRPGDELHLKTKNSVYHIMVDSDGEYLVSGGWFDKTSVSPVKAKINGCTWGGSVIKTDIVAAQGLFLEFGNRVVTSSIESIFFLPGRMKN